MPHVDEEGFWMAELRRGAAEILASGRSAIVDATFRSSRDRRRFGRLALRLPGLVRDQSLEDRHDADRPIVRQVCPVRRSNRDALSLRADAPALAGLLRVVKQHEEVIHPAQGGVECRQRVLCVRRWGAGPYHEAPTSAPGREFEVARCARTWWNTAVDRLLELLRERGFRRGRFVLSSGKESDFFIDCKPAVLLAEGHALVGKALHARIGDALGRVSAVAGVELGGCPLASAVACVSWGEHPVMDAVYIRKTTKEHGTKKMLEGADRLALGARLAIVEDTVTTGGSTLRAAKAVQAAGFEVAGVVAVVDRLEGGAEAIRDAGFAFSSLYDRADFMGER